MSEYHHLPPESLQIPHEVSEVEISINGIQKIFSTEDSAYWQYSQRYKSFDHIIKWLDEDADADYEIYFGLDQDDIDLLHDARITFIFPPYPSAEVIKWFWSVEMRGFDRELKIIGNNGFFNS